MTIVTMMERKESVEIDQAQFLEQFNLQADRDRHDLIFDVVEDIARILGRAEAQYMKSNYDELRDSLNKITNLGRQFGFGNLSRVAQDVMICVDALILFQFHPHSNACCELVNNRCLRFGTCQSIRDWALRF